MSKDQDPAAVDLSPEAVERLAAVFARRGTRGHGTTQGVIYDQVAATLRALSAALAEAQAGQEAAEAEAASCEAARDYLARRLAAAKAMAKALRVISDAAPVNEEPMQRVFVGATARLALAAWDAATEATTDGA